MIAVLLTGGNSNNIACDIKLVASYLRLFIGSIQNESRIHESTPWGFEADHNFLNQALVLNTELSPDNLLFQIWQIEAVFGRYRGTTSEELTKWNVRKNGGEVAYSSRNMDIDVLMYDFKPIETDLLTIPHPKITERTFVLIPLIDLFGGDFIFQGKSLNEHLSTL